MRYLIITIVVTAIVALAVHDVPIYMQWWADRRAAETYAEIKSCERDVQFERERAEHHRKLLDAAK